MRREADGFGRIRADFYVAKGGATGHDAHDETVRVRREGFEPSTQGLKGPCSASELPPRELARSGQHNTRMPHAARNAPRMAQHGCSTCGEASQRDRL
jgi:hypothetical protein